MGILCLAKREMPESVGPETPVPRSLLRPRIPFQAACTSFTVTAGGPLNTVCPIHRSFIVMSGRLILAVHSDSISTTPRSPVA
jgi:hypothetical protein